MDKHITFDLKEGKSDSMKGVKMLCISCKNMNREKATKFSIEALDKYHQYMKKYKNIAVVVNSTGFDDEGKMGFNMEVMLDRLKKLSDMDALAKKRIICTAVVTNNSFIRNTLNLMMSQFPPIRPVKLVANNEEAKEYIKQQVKNYSKA